MQNEVPWKDSLLEYGLRYHWECERYDQTVCRAVNQKGYSVPTTSGENALVSKNSRDVRNVLIEEIVSAGLASRPEAARLLRQAIKDSESTFGLEFAKEKYG